MSSTPKNTAKQQENLVFDAAVKCIEETSLLDFTMGAIAKEAGLSKGSIYKHVQSKEDVLVAISTRFMAHHIEVFAEVMRLPFTTPERLVCTVLLSPEKLHLYSFGVHLEMLVGNEAVLRRASPRWLEAMTRLDQALEAVFWRVLSQACEDGELMCSPKDRDSTMEMLMIGLWSLPVGFSQVAYQRHALQAVDDEAELPFPLPVGHGLVKNYQRLLNSYPWKVPLDDQGIEKARVAMEERGHR